MNRLVLFVEGKGDSRAVPNLVSRLIQNLPTELQGFLFVDDKPFVLGNPTGFSGKNAHKWEKQIENATIRDRLGAILAIFDGDADYFEDEPFCSSHVARVLAKRGEDKGAGTIFSLAVVIVPMEYESILIAANEQLTLTPKHKNIPNVPEVAPRDAKGWLDDYLPEGYDEATDQLRLTQLVKDWTPIREKMRSFKRLENAIFQLATAVSTGQHVATPRMPIPN